MASDITNLTSPTTDHSMMKKASARKIWPVKMQHAEVKWFPAGTRLIGLVRMHVDKFVLPPAVVRKASWRE